MSGMVNLVGKVFKHYNNTCYLYEVIDVCKIQVQNVWVEGVIYVRLFDNDNMKFVRALNEFNEKFNEVQVTQGGNVV